MIAAMKNNSGDEILIPDVVIAAYEGQPDVVRKLLADGVDPNSVDPEDNLSLLHIACLQGDTALAEILLEHDKRHGNLDFTIKSSYRPRLAWQFAANANRLELATKVHQAGLLKLGLAAPTSDP